MKKQASRKHLRVTQYIEDYTEADSHGYCDWLNDIYKLTSFQRCQLYTVGFSCVNV